MRTSATRLIAALTLLLGAADASAELSPELLTELQPLVETGLASDDVAVQSWALRAAGVIGGNAFRDAVLAALQNTEPAVRIAAAQTLLAMNQRPADAKAALTREVLEGDAAVRALVLNAILPPLGDAVRQDVVTAALSQSTDPAVTREITTHLAQRATGALHAVLERAATIESSEQRAPYVEPVLAAARPEGLGVARALLASRDTTRRLEGAEIAFAVNTVEARALLEPLLASPDAALAQRVGFHLARYGNAAALSQTVALARNTEMPEALRMEALEVIRDRGPQLMSWGNLQELLAESGHSPEFATRVYEVAGATRDPAALQALRELLDGLFADERLLGIAGYGYSGQLDAIPMMVDAIASAGDVGLRSAAAEALGHIGGDLAAEAAATALRTERVDAVRVALIRSLGESGSEVAAGPIANVFALQNDDLSLAALDALEQLGSSSVASQVEAVVVSARSPAVRWRATVVLAKLDPELGRIRLLQALDRPPEGFRGDLEGLSDDLLAAVEERLLGHTDTRIREQALFGLVRRPDRGYSVLRGFALAAPASDVRRQAIAVVIAEDKPEDADLFIQLGSDTDRSVRLQGLSALANLGDAANEELFRGYLNHADVALRMIATYAILRMHA